MEFLDARRLTGPSLLCNMPAAVLDIGCDPDQIETIVPLWREAVMNAHAELGWQTPDMFSRGLNGGLSLAFTADIDKLYAASTINEWAFEFVAAKLSGSPLPQFVAEAVAEALADELNPTLLSIAEFSAQQNTPFLWDDDEVSLGFGATCQVWPTHKLPDPKLLDFTSYKDVPIGIVTGTNGKTTTSRLARFILQNMGRQVGVSCTDWIAVNDDVIDRGDWSGPGGAREVLRQTRIDCAVLETARGGLLRRGLGVTSANAAVITNIAEDHLGDFGSRSMLELLDIKWIVSRAVQDNGTLILNADDPLLIQKSKDYEGRIVWFSLDANNPTLTKHLTSGGSCYALDVGQLVFMQGNDRVIICDTANAPITMNGAARHNIANALAAAALTHEMGAPLNQIGQGIEAMSSHDNPGRCNLFEIDGVKVLLDFAHNPHAMQALFDLAPALPSARRLLAFGQAGDRPDSLVREITRQAHRIGLDRVLVSELETYARGRDHGELYALIQDELVQCGMQKDDIEHFELETEALEAALRWARPGDLIIMLALGERDAIQARLASAADIQ